MSPCKKHLLTPLKTLPCLRSALPCTLSGLLIVTRTHQDLSCPGLPIGILLCLNSTTFLEHPHFPLCPSCSPPEGLLTTILVPSHTLSYYFAHHPPFSFTAWIFLGYSFYFFTLWWPPSEVLSVSYVSKGQRLSYLPLYPQSLAHNKAQKLIAG